MIEVDTKYDSLLENVLKGFKYEFKTSTNVIMEVLNVPLCAVKSILRDYGVSTENINETSVCIDEKMLDYFADAYVRKLKNYFVSSSRHISSISDKERQDLKEFYKLFKKQEVSNEQLGTWEDIDITLLNDSFRRKVENLTKEKYPYLNNTKAKKDKCISTNLDKEPLIHLEYQSCSCQLDFEEVVSIGLNKKDSDKVISVCLDEIILEDIIFYKKSKHDINCYDLINHEEIINERRDENLSTIIHYYAYKPKQRPQNYFFSIYIGRRKMFASARYYVFSDDDDHIN